MRTTKPLRVTDLERVFAASEGDRDILRALHVELGHRSTPSAVKLHSKIEDALAGRGKGERDRRGSAPGAASSHRSSEPPETRIQGQPPAVRPSRRPGRTPALVPRLRRCATVPRTSFRSGRLGGALADDLPQACGHGGRGPAADRGTSPGPCPGNLLASEVSPRSNCSIRSFSARSAWTRPRTPCSPSSSTRTRTVAALPASPRLRR